MSICNVDKRLKIERTGRTEPSDSQGVFQGGAIVVVGFFIVQVLQIILLMSCA
jgi:hypothetical protein